MPDTVTVLVILNDEDTIIEVFDTEEAALADLRENFFPADRRPSDDEVVEAMNSGGQMTFVHTTAIIKN